MDEMSHPDTDPSPTVGDAEASAAPPPAPGGGRYSIGPGDARADKDEIIELTERVLPDSPGTARYDKYYERNPFGPPSIMLARERESERLVGMATLFPTRLRVAGESVPAAISADFAIDPDHRGFGPALALQRASLATLGGSGLMCAYGCPNPFSEPVVGRVGFTEVGQLTRFVKVLRTRLLVDLFVSRPLLARVLSGLSVAVDPLTRLVFREWRGRRSREFSVERPQAFDERFVGLWEATWQRYGVCGERSPELLNWKYELDTGGASDYSVFAIVDAGRQVAGYVVYRAKDGIRHVFDIACRDSMSASDALLSEFIADSRSDGALGITFLHLGPQRLLGERLRSLGFLSRAEDKRLRVFVPEGGAPRVDVLERDNWNFLIGDDDF